MTDRPPYKLAYLSVARNTANWLRVSPERNLGKEGEQLWLGPFSRLNVFLGANNCGKSRTLRYLFHQNLVTQLMPAAIAEGAPELRQDVFRMINAESSSLGRHIAPILSQIQAMKDIWNAQNAEPNWRIRLMEAAGELAKASRENPKDRVKSLVGAVLARLGLSPDTGQLGPFERVYIPVLRGLREFKPAWDPEDPLGQIVRDQYFPTIRSSPNGVPVLNKGHHLLSGQDFYARIRRHLLGALSERLMIRQFEEYLSVHFFKGQPVSLIPKEGAPGAEDKHTLFIKIGDEQEQPVYRLGDGISQIVLMVFPLFAFRDQNLLLFIEEPENFLHPAFQRLLIEALLNLPCGTGGSRQVFVATHSNQFLDLTLDTDDVSVFHFQKSLPEGDAKEKEPVVTIRPRSNASMPLLRELGVRNSSVLLSNCTIWVEGPTDRMYIRHYLNLFQDDRGGEDGPV
ncbi:hypothetical protein PHYC_01104 [Phycisphaerales bacterium]|nr:hypothetical protein PHYC_01104 [Phycisphaerales bacterium]